MKIFILTGIFPIPNNPMNDIFITRRIIKILNTGFLVRVYSFLIQETFSYWVYKKIKKKTLNKKINVVESFNIDYNFLSVPNTLFDRRVQSNKAISTMTSAVINELKEEHYDLLHAHWVYPEGYVAALVKKETGIPLIISAHGDDIRINPHKYPGRRDPTKFALNAADCVFFTDNSLLKAARDLGYTGTQYLISPTSGVDTSVFYPMNKEAVQRRLSLEPMGKKYVGFIGSLVWVKRAELLPEIFSHIVKRDNRVECIIIGDGDLKRTIQERCSNHQIPVRFTGYVSPEEIPLWMNALDLLILPSQSEGMPNVVMEAQACGTPVVGSDAGGIPEAIGYGGRVVSEGPGFVERFGDAVCEILDNPPEPIKIRVDAMRFDSNVVIQKQIQKYNLFMK